MPSWKTGEQMMWDGYEEKFGLDLNQDSITGVYFEDKDENGLVDSSTTLKLISGDQVVDVVKGQKQRPLRDGRSWSALKAIQTDSGYEVLLGGTKGKMAGKFRTWALSPDGLIENQSVWRSGEQMMWDKYEKKFGMDLNQDSVTGVYFEDLDNNGLVDGSTTLKLINGEQTFDIVKGAKHRPQKNGSKWIAAQARRTESGYEVLIEGIKGGLDGKFKVWSIDPNGLFQKQSRWGSEQWMERNGYTALFDLSLGVDSAVAA